MLKDRVRSARLLYKPLPILCEGRYVTAAALHCDDNSWTWALQFSGEEKMTFWMVGILQGSSPDMQKVMTRLAQLGAIAANLRDNWH